MLLPLQYAIPRGAVAPAGRIPWMPAQGPLGHCPEQPHCQIAAAWLAFFSDPAQR